MLWFAVSVAVFLLVMWLRDREHCRASDVALIHTLEYESNANLLAACALNRPLLFQPNLHPEAYRDATADFLLDPASVIQGTTQMATRDADSLLLATGDREKSVWCETPVVGNHDALTAIDACLSPPWSPLRWKTRWTGSKGAVHPTWAHRGSRVYLTVVSGSVLVRMANWTTCNALRSVTESWVAELKTDCFGRTLMKSDTPLFDNTLRDNEGAALKYTEFAVPAGTTLYIPPYAWTSMQYLTDDSVLLCSAYSSWGNLVAYAEQYIPDMVAPWFKRQT